LAGKQLKPKQDVLVLEKEAGVVLAVLAAWGDEMNEMDEVD